MVRAVTPIPFVKARFFDRCGKPLADGKVYTYEANTTTPKVTYKDPYGLTPNTNPIILDAAGEADIYLDGTYRIRITDRNDVLINDAAKIGSWFSDNLQDTLDNISGAMDDALKPMLQNLDAAINAAAAAGAGANGWTASLIQDASGKTQQEINDKQPVINANLLGIMAGNDITLALSNFLNDSINSQMYLPPGEYTVSNKITVNATIPKKIIGQQGVVIKPNLPAGTDLFDCYSYFEHENLTIDFNNSYCKNSFTYRASVGTVRFDNLTMKNLNDTASNYGTNLVYIDSSNVIDIGKVTFSNCKKLGNGSITDAEGSLQCLYISGTSTTPRGGVIDTIEITDVHNVNSSGNVIIEDTAGLYVGVSGYSIPLTVRRVLGKEFGKRLVKLQGSDVNIDYIYGLSETGDSLSVIGVMSEPNLFTSYRNKIGTVIARGLMDYAVADSAESTEFKSVDINVYGNNTLNDGTVQFGFFAGNGSKKLRVGKLKSIAKRPLALSPANPSLSVSDLAIDDAELEIYGNGTQFINIPGNASSTMGAISDISIKKLTLNVKQTNPASLLATFNAQLNYANITIDRLLVRDSVSTDASRKFDFGVYYHINGLTINEIVYSSTNALTSKTGDLFTLNNCKNVSIGRVVGLPTCNRGVILTACTDVNISKDMRLDSVGVGAVVVTGASTKVAINNPALVVYNAATNLAEVKFSRGTTAQRPLRAEVGYQYFDTTINKPIFCKTAAVFASDGSVTTAATWIDSAGVTV